MLLDQGHVRPIHLTSNILVPECGAFIQKALLSEVDPSTIRRNWLGNVSPASYTIGSDGNSVLNKQPDTYLTCSVTGKPRFGKLMMRVKFSGASSTYNAIVALSSYSLAGRLAYIDLLPVGAWVTVRIEYESPGIYRLYANNTLFYRGACMDLGFYFGKGSTKVEFDVGQMGTPLLSGYGWY